MKNLKNKYIGEILDWNEVSEIHRVRNGIYQKDEKLISLLTDFGKINPCYPDFAGDNKNEIFYTGAGRRGDQKLDVHNRALLNAVESGHSVPLFNKLTVGKWEFLGILESVGRQIYFRRKKQKNDLAIQDQKRKINAKPHYKSRQRYTVFR